MTDDDANDVNDGTIALLLESIAAPPKKAESYVAS